MLSSLPFRLSSIYRLPVISWLGLFSLLVVGCASVTDSEFASAGASADQLKVVVTNTVLADLTRQVAGNLAEVVSIIPAASDAHAFQPTPSDNRFIAEADVIISNGMGFDDFLNPILENSRRDKAVNIVVTHGLVLGGTAGDVPIHEVGDPHLEVGDPHLWLNPVFAEGYVVGIRDGLIKADPERSGIYSSNARAYIEQLRALDREIDAALRQVPSLRRNLVSYHDAFGHFGDRYGWKTTSLVPHHAGDTTPEDFVRVVTKIVDDGIPTVFIEPQLESKVMQAAAREAGATSATIRTLVDESAPSYIAMMRNNTQSLVDNLR